MERGILEEVRVLVFVSAVLVVFACAAVMAAEYILQRVTLKGAPPTRRYMWIRRVTLCLATFGLLCIAYGYFIEPYWIEVTHFRIESPKLPKGTRPIRIVHISDLHSDPQPRLEERLPKVIAAEKPALIVFTGDSINSPQGLPVLKRCLKRLAGVAPTYVVKGNWDAGGHHTFDLFADTDVRELRGEAVKVEVGGAELWVAGVPFGATRLIDKALSGVPPGAFTLFLYHTPDEIAEVARRKVDLYCAGHTHGGQVALPFYGALVTLSKFGKKYEAGLYRVDQTWLYVNRGIGMEGDPAPRVRFCARPEVTVIDLVPLM